MVLPGSSWIVAWIGSRLGEASTTSAPRFCKISRGPNSSHSSKPSVATMSIRDSEIRAIGTSFHRRSLMPADESSEARNAVLRHSSDSEPGYTRKRMGRYWAYFDGDKRVTGRATIDRLNAVALPPAYKQVWFCKDADGHLQATGVDDRGRKQYRYHVDFRARRENAKYDGMLEFGRAL